MKKWLNTAGYIALLSACAPTQTMAQPIHGGTILSGTVGCSKTGDITNDGCLANPGGTFQNISFDTNVRQSGQGVYAATAPWNRAGVDYAIGNYTADGSLTDIKTFSFSGCSGFDGNARWICHSTKAVANASVSGNTLTVNSLTSGTIAIGQSLNFFCDPGVSAFCATHPTVTAGSGTNWTISGSPVTVSSQAINFVINPAISHVSFNDILYVDDGLGNNSFDDVHVTLALNTCRNKGLPAFQVGFGDTHLWNIKFDLDPICSPYAFFYKQSGDPGLPTYGTGTMHITAGVMTIDSFTGQFGIGQTINYTGQTTTAYMAWTTNDSSFFNCTNSACITHTANLTVAPCDEYLPSCALASSLNVGSSGSPVAFSVGPLQENTEFMATGGAGWSTASVRYSAMVGGVDFLGTGTGGSADIRFNYAEQTFYPGIHGEVVSNQPAPGASTTIPFFTCSFNTAFEGKLSRGGQGTAFCVRFARAGGTAYSINTAVADISSNTLVANTSINPSGQTMGFLYTIDGQTSTLGTIGTLNMNKNYGDITGAFGSCSLDPNVAITTKNSSGNVNMVSGATFGC